MAIPMVFEAKHNAYLHHTESLKTLLQSGKYSDLTIICGPQTFKVHKAIICPQSEYSEAACTPGRFKEGEENVIRLQAVDPSPNADNFACDDPDAVKRMVDFFYASDYDVDPVVAHKPSTQTTPGPSTDVTTAQPQNSNMWIEPSKLNSGTCVSFPLLHPTDRSLTAHTQVFALAIKYQIPSVRSLAAAKFAEAFTHGVYDGMTAAADVSTALTAAYTIVPESAAELRECLESKLVHPACVDLLQSKDVAEAVEGVEGLAYKLLIGAQQEQNSRLPPWAMLPSAAGVDYVVDDRVISLPY